MPTDETPTDPAPANGRNTLFDYTDAVFDDEALLEIGHLPDPERIVGRDEHMQKVADALNPAIFGSAPSHLFVFGKTGTGKTLISRSVTEMLQTEADREGVTVKYAFVDCGEKNTEASVVKRVAQSMNDPDRTDLTVPERGLATADYYERLWTVLDTCTDVAIVILDEIDMLENDEVLRKLSRASENRRVDDARIGVIGISNKIDYPDRMSERVKSSFSRDELVFPPYDANQLGEILENRRDAFHDGVLTDDAIPLAAALAAQEHGDARKAIDILRNAGRIAKRTDHDTVTEAHIRRAKEKTEVDRLAELIDGSPLQAKVLLYALTKLTTGDDRVEFTSREIYRAYTRTAAAIDLDALSERRTRELLQEQDFLNVIDSTKESRGRGEGVTGKHRLLESPGIVLKVLRRDDRLEPLDA